MGVAGGLTAIGYPYRFMVGIAFCALGSALLFTYFRTNPSKSDKSTGNNRRCGKHKSSIGASKIKNSKEKVPEISIKLAIANEHIPLVVGRGGSNLKSIEDRTQTSINFRDIDDQHQWCEIKGQPDQVYEAEQLILRETERVPNITEEMYISEEVYGDIAGFFGQTVKEICRISLAKIDVDVVDEDRQMRRINITGNRQQVNMAIKLIDEKIEQNLHLKRDLAEAEQKREPRRSNTNSANSSQTSLNVLPIVQAENVSMEIKSEKINGNASEINIQVNMKVYVSAVESPSKFWVQLLGPQIKRLDDLVEDMTEYYGNADNRALHKIQVPYLGQIVATALKTDNKWYRAEIARILPNQYNPDEVVLDLFFLDYGDRKFVLPKEIFELRTDYLTLRFQAVECFLANVQSATIAESKTDSWDAQAIDYFEQLVQADRWKQLKARVVMYKDRFQTTTSDEKSCEKSSILGVELFDYLNDVEVNLNETMITNGYAVAANANNEGNLTDTNSSSPNSFF